VHQHEGYSSFQRHETHVSKTRHENEKTRVSQLALIERDNQKCEVRVSAQQRHETHVLKAKRKSRACYAQCGLRISEPCVSNYRHKGDPQKLKSPRQHEGNLFDPLPTDLRDYLTKKRSANLITPSFCCERVITTIFSECRCSSHASKQSIFRQSTPISRSATRYRSHRRGPSLTWSTLKSL